MEKNEIKDILKEYVKYGEKDYFEAITAKKVFGYLKISEDEAQIIKSSPEYKALKESIGKLKSIYGGIERRCKKDNIENGFNDFVNFYEWHQEQPQEQVNGKAEKICRYCGTTESNLKKLFKEKDDKTEKKKKPLYSKKRSFTATLQVDRKNPDEGYNGDNCVLACALCNNAKSDMINYENFKTYFKKSMQSFIKDLLSGKITNNIGLNK